MDLVSNIDLLFMSSLLLSCRVFRFISYYQSKTKFTCPVVEKLGTYVLLISFGARIIAAGQVYNLYNPGGHSDRSFQYPVPDIRAYCDDDIFNVSCRANEVITTASAAFGRMGSNRCFVFPEREFLNLDVKSEIEMECSGMQKCSFSVYEIQKKYQWCFRSSKRCLLDLDYTCLPVNDPPRCDGQQLLTQSGTLSSARYLSDFSTEDRPDVVCPWTIQAPSSHWINLTLEDFTPSQGNRCVEYGTVTESSHNFNKTVKICGGNKGVIWNRVFKFSSVNLTLNLQAVANHRFLIHYSVVGCPPIIPIRDSWIENLDKFNVIIHCNSTYDHWQLKCVGTTWIGNTSDNRTCTIPTSESAIPSSGEWLLLIIGVAIGTAVGAVLVCIINVFMRRSKRRGNVNCNSQPAVSAEQTLQDSCLSPSYVDGPYCDMSINHSYAAIDQYSLSTGRQSRSDLHPYLTIIHDSNGINNSVVLTTNDSISSDTGDYRSAQFHSSLANIHETERKQMMNGSDEVQPHAHTYLTLLP